jgi:hypothetical protein
MAHAADHLSVVELEERYRTCTDACSAQTIWLLAQGHTIEETAETTCFVLRWIEELLAPYNAIGPQALGGNAASSISDDHRSSPALGMGMIGTHGQGRSSVGLSQRTASPS